MKKKLYILASGYREFHHLVNELTKDGYYNATEAHAHTSLVRSGYEIRGLRPMDSIVVKLQGWHWKKDPIQLDDINDQVERARLWKVPILDARNRDFYNQLTKLLQ